MVQDKYITICAARKNVEEARTFFLPGRRGPGENLGQLDSGTRLLDTHERLRILHGFFRPGEEQYYSFDLGNAMRLGHDFRDYICPDGMRFRSDHFEMGGRFGRVLFLRDYPSYIKDTLISELSDFPRNLMLSIDILPIPTAEAVRDMQQRIMGVESDITRWQQRQNNRSNFTAAIPYELEQLRAENREFLDDLSARDQRMIHGNITLVHLADTLEQLNADTEALQSIGQERACQFSVLRYQQEDGLNTALPYGPAADHHHPHPHHRERRRLNTFPGPGDPRRRRYLLRRQRGIAKPPDLQPQATPQSPRLYSGRVRLRQVLQHETGHYLYRPVHQR